MGTQRDVAEARDAGQDSETTGATVPAASFRRFIETLTGLVSEYDASQEATLVSRGGDALRELVASDDWLPDAYAQPSPERYQQFLLYRDPSARFSVVSFVWGPGQRTPIHDHTVWGLIGMLRGAEVSTGFARSASGDVVPTGEDVTLQPGAVEAVSPTIGDIHRVANLHDDAVSISIHVYGADIGQVERWVYPEGGGAPKRFVSGYSNGALPALLV
ncbi:cysteine dioxygenase [Robbsia sp. KACC 23696]|uniref:cysteine dioxygenase family protein n=1 Tax=Robbsia sp. KACC 23696 TaxID=3149231 RepID=UPI00325AFD07